MPPSTAALFSSGVPCARLLDANLGVSGLILMIAKRPLASNIANPVPFGPKMSTRLPSWRILTFETLLHVPTRYFAVWAITGAGKATPTTSAMVASVMIPFLGLRRCGGRERILVAPGCRSFARRRVTALCPILFDPPPHGDGAATGQSAGVVELELVARKRGNAL